MAGSVDAKTDKPCGKSGCPLKSLPTALSQHSAYPAQQKRRPLSNSWLSVMGKDTFALRPVVWQCVCDSPAKPFSLLALFCFAVSCQKRFHLKSSFQERVMLPYPLRDGHPNPELTDPRVEQPQDSQLWAPWPPYQPLLPLISATGWEIIT